MAPVIKMLGALWAPGWGHLQNRGSIAPREFRALNHAIIYEQRKSRGLVVDHHFSATAQALVSRASLDFQLMSNAYQLINYKHMILEIRRIFLVWW